MTIYVDYILLMSSNTTYIFATKDYLHQHFTILDLEKPCYFFRIEFAYQQDKLTLSQRKYVIDLLQEMSLLGYKSKSSPMEA